MPEDKVLDKLGEKTFPGCLLLRLGVGSAAQAADTAEQWAALAGERELKTRVPYIVRVHVFQCRDLPAADDDGMIDPYLKINVLGTVRFIVKSSS